MKFRDLRKFPINTLRGRLILSVAAVHAVMMTLFIFDSTVRQRAMLLDNQMEEAVTLSRSLATSAAGWIAAADISGLQEIVEAERRYPELLFAILADKDGRVLAHTDKGKLGLYMLDLPGEARQTTLGRTPALVDVAVPAMLGDRHVGWVRIGLGQKKAAQKLASITLMGLLYALGAIIVGSLVAWSMGRRITRRLYAVQDTISRVRAGDRETRSGIAGSDEAASIAREFNDMLDMLDERGRAVLLSESKYRLLLRNIHTAVMVHGPDTGILMSNPRAQELLGLTEEQMMGKSAIDPDWNFFSEDGTVLPLEEYPVSRVLNTGQPLRNAVLGLHRAAMAENVWVLVSADPVPDGRGAIAEIIVSFIDITERKRAEEALQNTARLLNEAQRLAHIGSWELDLVHNVLTWSDEIFRMFEIDPEKFDATYEAFLKTIHPDDREAVNVVYTSSLKNKIPYAVNHRLLLPDERVIYVHEQCETFYDGDKPLRSIGTVQDITERKQAEEALHRLNRELRAISDCNQAVMRSPDEQALLDGVCRIVCEKAGYGMAWVGYAENDAAKIVRPMSWAGIEEGYLAAADITWANDTARGCGPTGTAIRSGETDIIQDFTTDPHAAPWRELALQRGYRSSIALPLKGEGDNTFGVLNIYSMEPNAFTPDEMRLLEELAGDLAFGIAVLRARIKRALVEESLNKLTGELEQRVKERTADLKKKSDELKESQAALVNIVEDLNEKTNELGKVNAKLQELDRLKSMFIASMSHELRTPLSSIIGFSSILLNEWVGPMTREQKDNLNAILRSGKHLLSLINDVIDVSKIEAGKVESINDEFDVYDIVSETVKDFEKDINNKGLELEVRAVHQKIYSDRRRLLQCLLNLVSNAVKFTEYGAIKICVNISSEGKTIVISVSDTGIGIKRDDIEKLFTPFVRLDSPLKSKVLGTGLGLYLTKKLTREVLQGDITVASTYGEGSRFEIKVPVSC